MQQEEYLKKLYANRFDYKQKKAKLALWKVLIDCFLQKHIGDNSIVLDIGRGVAVSLLTFSIAILIHL